MLPVFAWAPLAYPGYFEFLSGFSPIFNLNDFLQHGASLAWAPSVGQPYDLLRGDGRLAYLLAAVPRVLGASGSGSVKVLLAAAILVGALGIYSWARRSFGSWPALVAAAVYAFWPLGLATIYVRGAVGEAALLAIMPLAWWAAAAAGEPAERGRWGARVGLALAIAAALWAQAGLGLWLCAGILVYLVARNWVEGERGRGDAGDAAAAAGGRGDGRTRGPGLLGALAAWAAGVGVGLLGLVPVVLGHGGLGNASYVQFGEHFVYPYQLLQPGLSVAPGAAGAASSMPLQLGLVACGLAVMGLVLAGEPRATDEDGASAGSTQPGRRLMWVGMAFVLVPVLLTLAWATPLWAALPAMQRTLTYPWQLLLLAGPWLAWLAGLGALALAERLPGEAGIRGRGDAETRRRGEAETRGGFAGDGAGSAEGWQDGAPVVGSSAEPYAGAPRAMPLFVALVGLALLGVYGDLNPLSTPVAVPERPLAVFGDNQIALLSARVPAIPRPGQPVSVTVQWQALRPIDQDFSVFLHAMDAGGAPQGQQDTMPRANQYPTSRWQPGEVVEDVYTVSLKPGSGAATPYRYELGLYDYRTGKRLAVASGADNIVLDGK